MTGRASNSPRDVHARKMAQWSYIRRAECTPWVKPCSEKTHQRMIADCEILKRTGAGNLAIELEVACDCVTTTGKYNVGDFMYAGFDSGARTADGYKILLSDGTTRTIQRQWYWALYAIQLADERRSNA